MKQLKDNQLVWRVKVKKCDKSLLELISRHTPLFYKISQKYFPFAFKGGSSQTVDDIIGSCESLIYESILEYKSTRKVKFSTWLGNFVRYKCLNYLNKNSKLVDAEEGKLNFFFQKKSLEEYSKATEVDDHIFVNNLIDQFKDDLMVLENQQKREEVKNKILGEMEKGYKKDNFFSEEERVIISNFLNKIINELELKINK